MIQTSLFLNTRVNESVSMLKEYEPQGGFYLAFSGGRDSVTVWRLAQMAGVKFDGHFHRSGVDPHQTIQFIKTTFPDVSLEKPEVSMFDLIVEKGIPPTRRIRYCCRWIKEVRGQGRVVLTGVRRDESQSRRKRQLVWTCPSQAKIVLNPILHWTSDEVWEFTAAEGLPVNPLYGMGFARTGCLMCPNGYWKQRIREALMWPKTYRAYLRAFDRMLERRRELKKETSWRSSLEVMEWWLEGHTIEEPLYQFGGAM